jgi:hypothetical protein
VTGTFEDGDVSRDNQIADNNDDCEIHSLHYFTMPRVAQQPRAAKGRNVSGSMAASSFKSPVKYENIVIIFSFNDTNSKAEYHLTTMRKKKLKDCSRGMLFMKFR